MKIRYWALFLVIFALCGAYILTYAGDKNKDLKTQTKPGEKMKDNISDITVKDMDGKEVHLSDYIGKVLLIVNVASKCGYTPQYKDLEAIYKEYKDKGFEILGFPCNDFGKQEPGTNEEIKTFCSTTYNVTFKLFNKIKVLGDDKEPLYALLTDNDVTPKLDIRWNFEKFLISKDGKILERFASNVKPTDKEVVSAIEEALKN